MGKKHAEASSPAYGMKNPRLCSLHTKQPFGVGLSLWAPKSMIVNDQWQSLDESAPSPMRTAYAETLTLISMQLTYYWVQLVGPLGAPRTDY